MSVSSQEHPNNTKKEKTFNSSVGILFSCLGCVVGTGNVWRFPRIAARNSQNGGSLVFLIVWLCFLLLWSIPMILIEYGMGRYCRRSPIKCFQYFMGNKGIWCGCWPVIVSFLISCYYSVILGWCLYYVYFTIAFELPKNDVLSTEAFEAFAEKSSWQPIACHAIGLFVTVISAIGGIKWIEKANLVLVPTLLLLMVVTFIWSLTRAYANLGITYLFTPAWESIKNPSLWVDAASQNAFDTGAAAALITAYASYFNQDNGIVRYATVVPVCNNLVSLLAAITMFSTVFSTIIAEQPTTTFNGIINILETSGTGGTGITFIWIPVLFSGLGIAGRVLCVLYFVCLSCAGFSSLLANVELSTLTLTDFGIPRKLATPIVGVLMFCVGLGSSMSMQFLTNQDFVWGFALMIAGLFYILAVVVYGAMKFRRVVVNKYGTNDWNLPFLWIIIITLIAPLEALGLLGWWGYSLISENPDTWYTVGWETFMTTIIEWVGVLLILICLNVVLVIKKPSWIRKNTREPEVLVEEKVIEPTTTSNTQALPVQDEGHGGSYRVSNVSPQVNGAPKKVYGGLPMIGLINPTYSSTSLSDAEKTTSF